MDNPWEKVVLKNSDLLCRMLPEIFHIDNNWKFIQLFIFKWQLFQVEYIQISRSYLSLGYTPEDRLWEDMQLFS